MWSARRADSPLYSPDPSDVALAEEQVLLGEKAPGPHRPLNYAPRKSRIGRIPRPVLGGAGCGIAALCLLAAAWLSSSHLVRANEQELACPAYAYDSGSWVRKASYPFAINNEEELYAAAGYSSCAFSTEGGWEWFGHKTPRVFAERVDPMSYEWQPHEQCHLRRPDVLQKLQALVDGALVLIGDSLTRQHFFQISCELAQHVKWNGTEVPAAYQEARRWRFSDQHLLLDPASPLIKDLRLPRGYDFTRPIVSYVGVWLPQSFKEIKAALGEQFPYIEEPEAMWYDYELSKTMHESIDYVMDPANGYQTMLFTLGAHYSGAGLHFAKEGSSNDLLPIARWSFRTYLTELKNRLRPDQRVLVRASPSGLQHPDPQKGMQPHVPDKPLLEVALPPPEYNWQAMPDLIRILEDETRLLNDRRFIWMGGDRPSRTRPDARHMDGLHTAVGTGVIEAVSQYMWHWITASR